ncbi:MAG: hypothetical protein ABIR60_08560 [Allosphingosinicella sp.]
MAADRKTCSACGAAIKWAHFVDGVKPIEPCGEGEGDVAIQAPLPGIDGKTTAVIVSGVRTTWRLHLSTCTRAGIWRNRWKTKLVCRGCGVPMLVLENGRTVCRTCQKAEAFKLAELAGVLVDRFGPEEAVDLVGRALAIDQAAPPPPAPLELRPPAPPLRPGEKAYSYAPKPRKRRP